ncbi:MAG: hypothetical protein M3R27_13590, partial [Bacteroidota bacterium]|nr:hypothetical protein [Bacteroidota bacterium]
MARKATDYLSQKLKTRVEIGTLEIEFLKTIVLTDVYIEDLHHDTLLFSKKLKVDIGKLDFENRTVRVSSVVLLNTKAALVKYREDEDLNFQFIIDLLDSKDTVKRKSQPWDVSFGEVTFVNTVFDYRNEHDTIITTGVNFTDLSLSNVNGRLTDIRFDNDTIFAGIDYLSAIEKSGFILKNLTSYVKLSSTGLTLNEMKLKTPESFIETDLVLTYKSYRDYNDFINKVKFNAQFNKSTLEMSDIAYFAPELKGVYKKLMISGKMSGRVNDLRGKDLDISTGTNTRFMGDVTLTGLPKIEETLIHLSIKSLTTNYNDLRQLPVPPFEKHGTLSIPPNIAKLGNMKFKGTFTGLYNDFYAYGDFSSALGRLSSDLSVSHDMKRDKQVYKGKLKSIGFDFGKFLSVPLVGKASMSVDIDGSGLTLEEITARLTGT